MIVTSVEQGWEVVFQKSHGLLAGRIAAEFRDEFRPLLWVETLEAILSHDDYKEDFDGKHYVTELGAPKDFTLVSMGARDRLAEAQRRLRESYRKHRWVGLLISRHQEHLYGDNDDVSHGMRSLLDDERDRRRRVLRKMGLKKADLEHAYQLLRWCDRCSLILTRGDVPAMGRQIEVTHGLRGERYLMWRRDDDALAVEPWPFANQQFDVAVEVRQATRLSFDDDRDLIDHLEASEVENRVWRFSNS
ncbi:DUF3891 family protein [Botrimarina sp.]|uniref:DUF3891 family protein n=1 Tax=Botrimarina sp. TaxID=2795802 RepID=UPI0032EFE4A8